MADIMGSAAEVFDSGLKALRKGDLRTYRACVDELQTRRTRKARELAEELAEEGDHPRDEPASWQPQGFAVDLGRVTEPVTLLTDSAIVEARTRVVQAATRSLWLSTYTFVDKDRSLTRLLAKKARDGVRVTLFVSYGQDRNRTSELLDELARAGVDVHAEESTHSKVVVADDAEVLLGSANLNRTHRDLALHLRSASLAREITRYLEALAKR